MSVTIIIVIAAAITIIASIITIINIPIILPNS